MKNKKSLKKVLMEESGKKIPKGIRYWDDEWRALKWCYERRIEGKRVRTFFSSLEAAIAGKEAAEKAMKSGADGRKVFDGASQREYEAAKKIVGAEVSLIDVAMFWVKHESLRSYNPVKVSQVADEFLETAEKRGLSISSLRSLRYHLSRITNAFGLWNIAEVDGKLAAEWIAGRGMSPTTSKDTRAKFVQLLQFAKDCGYLREIPNIPTQMLPRVERNPVVVHSIEETRMLMDAVREVCPHLIPNFALRAFCGLRTAEAARMKWEWIDVEGKRIVIPASICKTRDDWVLQSPMLPDTVFSWLALTPVNLRGGHVIAPVQYDVVNIQNRLPWEWKKNAMRHTFCTMHISLEQSADKTALLMRHRGASMMFQHYLAKLVKPEEAREFFNIRPQ